MKRINVCLVNDSFPPTIDGVANVVANYAKHISKLGKAVVSTPYDPEADDSKYDFPIYRYPSIDTKQLFGYRTGLPFSFKTLNEIEKEDIDIIHTHCPMTSCFLARMMRDITNKPVVLTWHTKYDIDVNNAIRGKLLRKEAIDAIIANVNACDEVWTVSKGAGENLKSLGYKGEYIVMENGVDLPKEKLDRSIVDELLKDYDIPENKPILLFVGRMMWYKNIKLIIDGLKQLKDDNVDYAMFFIGNGADKNEIVEYVKKLNLDDRITFCDGIRDRQILRAWYSRADLFLFPSTFDTNGLVVREAAACGLASVLVKDSCAAENTIDNQNAYLIDEDSHSLFLKLKDILPDLSNIHQVGNNAQNEIYISWEDAVKKAYDRYQIVMDNYAKSGKKHDDKLSVEVYDLLSDGLNDYKKVKERGEELIDKINGHYAHLIHNLKNDNLINPEKTLKEIHNMIDELRKLI